MWKQWRATSSECLEDKTLEIWPLGVFVSCDAGLGLPLETVQEVGVPTVQLHAPRPESRSAEHVSALRNRLSDLHIVPTCMFAGFAGESYADIPTVERTVGLAPPATRAARLADLKHIADFARDLGVKGIGLHLGFVPPDPEDPEYHGLLAATSEICEHAAAQGQSVHLETGQEPVDVLVTFIQDVARDNLGVNFDPANMILYGVGEPLPCLVKLAPYIRSVHCKDAIWSDQPGRTWGQEVPLGQGDVNMEAYLQTLLAIGYHGPLTIEREIPCERDRQKAEILAAVSLLSQIKRNLID
jgi:sugar phosphate isomerase/epimerase